MTISPAIAGLAARRIRAGSAMAWNDQDWVPVAAIYGAEQSSIRPVRDTMRFLRMMLRFLFRR